MALICLTSASGFVTGYVQLMDASSSCIGEASSLASFKNDEADFKASLQSLSKEELIQRWAFFSWTPKVSIDINKIFRILYFHIYIASDLM